MKKSGFRRVAAVLAALALALGLGNVALAHPLGNFTINHYSRLEIARDEIRIRYVLDYAEIPTFQAKQDMDTNADGTIDAAETSGYLQHTLREVQKNLVLQAGTRPLTPELVAGSQELQFSEGQGGLQTMRVAAWFRAPFALNQTENIEYRDTNFAERLGWREIVAAAQDGVSLVASNVPAQDISHELRAYPPSQLTSPPDERAAELTVALGAGQETLSEAPGNPAASAFSFDRTLNDFAALAATKQELSLSVIAASLLAAMALGALHAFEPGHGKAIVGAYLVGSRGTALHALLLGLIVTATHTMGVYALGLVTLFASRYILPEQLYPWLGVLSGALVAILGVRLFWERVRGKPHSHTHAGTPGEQEHQHTVELGTAHEHVHADSHKHAHKHPHADSHKHAHEHPHAHSHKHAHEHPHAHSHSHDLNGDAEAEHARAHLAPLLKDERLAWKSFVWMGVSGGLLPCPSALVVMLSAIALGRVAFGLALIVAFSLGLAGVLTATGVLFLYAGRFAGRFVRSDLSQNWFWRFLPLGSALVVMVLGLGIAAESLRLLTSFR